MKGSSEPTNKKAKVFSAVCLTLFFAFSLLILVESAFPSGPSGKQSEGFSAWLASLINAIAPSKEAEVFEPTALSVSSSIPSYTKEDGEKVYLFSEDKAVIGTTRMFNYSLSYPEGATLFSSEVEFLELSSPREGSYTKTVSASSIGGAVRIVPLELGEYSFSLTDSAGHKEEIAFECVPRLAPNELANNIEEFNLSVGETKDFPLTLTFGDYSRGDETVQHYLSRFIDPSLAEFASSDESVFTVSKGGAIKGVGEGDAELLFKGEKVSNVHVSGNLPPREIASMSLSAEKTTVSPLDFDYQFEEYGTQLTPHFFNATGEELFFETAPAVFYESEDPLIAMVDNVHGENYPEGFEINQGGFVAGYRKKGTTNIRATLEENSEISATIEFTSEEVPPSTASFSVLYNGKTIESGAEAIAGNTLSIQGSFEPANCMDKNIHVEVLDASLVKVLNNDTNSPQINLLKEGKLTFSVYSTYLGKESAVSFTIEIESKPVISDDNMNEFSRFMRKAAGHLTLFAVTAFFGALGLFSSKTHSSTKGLLLLFVAFLFTGFALAGFSELIQAIPVLRRGSTWMDVGIDFLGFSLAAVPIFLIFFIVQIVKNVKRKKS